MSTLARDVDSYQRALAAYQRRAASYNRGVDQYKQSIVRDAAGNVLLKNSRGGLVAVDAKGMTTTPQLPVGFDQRQYETTPLKDNAAFSMLRQNGADGKYPESPEEWTEEFKRKAPDPTKAQMAQAGRPSLARQEAGLLGEVIYGSGLKSGPKGLVRGQMEETAAPVETVDPETGKPMIKTPVMVA